MAKETGGLLGFLRQGVEDIAERKRREDEAADFVLPLPDHIPVPKKRFVYTYTAFDLIRAVTRNNVDMLRRILASGMNTDVMDKKGLTPLLHTIRSGNVECASMLLEAGADPSVTDLYGNSCLFYAARTGDIDLVKFVIGLPGVDVNVRNYSGQTPLHCVASIGHEVVTEHLLRHPDVDINPRDKYLLTPFYMAVRNDLFEIVDLFLDSPKGVEVDTMNEFGATAMHYCAQRGMVDMMKKMALHPYTDIDKADVAGATPLHWACKKGTMQVIKYLFQNPRVDPVKPDHHGDTPLHYAAGEGHHLIVKFMVTRRPRVLTTENINALNHRGQSPLDLADANMTSMTAGDTRLQLVRFKVREAGDDRSLLLM